MKMKKEKDAKKNYIRIITEIIVIIWKAIAVNRDKFDIILAIPK